MVLSQQETQVCVQKPTADAATQALGIGDFTITIGDHDITGNPINDLPRD